MLSTGPPCKRNARKARAGTPRQPALPPESETASETASGAAADRTAWQGFAARVRPLRGRPVAAPPPTPPQAAVAGPTPSGGRRPQAAVEAPRPLVIGEAPAGLDRATWRRLSAGRIRPVRRLDLHGLTAARAFSALAAVLAGAAEQGERTVEVITGRGQGPQGGVIRRELPDWLNRPELRLLLLGACHPHPANPGSVLLLLRRRK